MNEGNERIKLNMSTVDIVSTMSDGNPGAVKVCCELLKYAPMIDPDAAMGGLIDIMHLDSMHIYGGEIWILYKNVCGESVNSVVLLLRGHQLGIISKSEIESTIKDRVSPNFDSILREVKKIAKNFNYEYTT